MTVPTTEPKKRLRIKRPTYHHAWVVRDVCIRPQYHRVSFDSDEGMVTSYSRPAGPRRGEGYTEYLFHDEYSSRARDYADKTGGTYEYTSRGQHMVYLPYANKSHRGRS